MPRLPRVILLALFTFAPVLGAQQTPNHATGDSTKVQAVRRLLAVTRTADMVVSGMESALQAQQAGEQPLPAQFVTEFTARVRRDIAEFVDMLVPVYDSLYSLEEVRGLTAFYQTPLGQRLLDTQPRLMAAASAAGERWGARVAEAVMGDLQRAGVEPR